MNNIINGLAQPVNHVAQAYERRTQKIENDRKEEQANQAAAVKQRDEQMLQVFEFAGDGRTEEAKILAQQKGLNVPEEIYSNGDFAKGLAAAGSFYGDDPQGAQRFAMAWMQTRDNPDYAQRVLKASQMAGKPIDPEDRRFQQKMALEKWKVGQNHQNDMALMQGKHGNAMEMQGYKNNHDYRMQDRESQLDAQDYRRDLFADATKASLGSFSPDANAGANAVKSSDQFFNQPSQNLTSAPLNVRNNNPGNMRPVGGDSGFQQFNSPQEGMQAMRNDLSIKVGGRSNAMKARFGDNYTPTISTVISTWAPPEENDTQKYINFVAQQSGIDPNSPLSQQDIERIIPAMIQMEGGQSASSYYAPQQQQAPQPQAQAQPQGHGGNANTYSEAMMAISSGANPQEVYARLQQMGIDPSPIMNN